MENIKSITSMFGAFSSKEAAQSFCKDRSEDAARICSSVTLSIGEGTASNTVEITAPNKEVLERVKKELQKFI